MTVHAHCATKEYSKQINIHVLSNCDSPIALDRYLQRHNNILLVLADWVNKNISKDQKLYVDMDFSSDYNPVSEIIEPIYRPDIVLSDPSAVIVWELTVCHETNLAKSKLYKL